jgi:hypothetical protein
VRYRISFTVTMDGELTVEASSEAEACRILREDTGYATLTEGFNLGQQYGDVSIYEVEELDA